MKLLFYRYGSICEPDIIAGFQELGLEVSELTEEISNKSVSPQECIHLVSNLIMFLAALLTSSLAVKLKKHAKQSVKAA